MPSFQLGAKGRAAHIGVTSWQVWYRIAAAPMLLPISVLAIVSVIDLPAAIALFFLLLSSCATDIADMILVSFADGRFVRDTADGLFALAELPE